MGSFTYSVLHDPTCISGGADGTRLLGWSLELNASLRTVAATAMDCNSQPPISGCKWTRLRAGRIVRNIPRLLIAGLASAACATRTAYVSELFARLAFQAQAEHADADWTCTHKLNMDAQETLNFQIYQHLKAKLGNTESSCEKKYRHSTELRLLYYVN